MLNLAYFLSGDSLLNEKFKRLRNPIIIQKSSKWTFQRARTSF